MMRSFPVARNVLLNLLAVALLLVALRQAQTPFATVATAATALVYVTVRGAIAFLDYAVSSKAEEGMDRVSRFMKPSRHGPEIEGATGNGDDRLAVRQKNFWINIGFDCLITLITISSLLETFLK